MAYLINFLANTLTQKFTLILQGEPCRQKALKHTLRENKTTFKTNLT